MSRLVQQSWLAVLLWRVAEEGLFETRSKRVEPRGRTNDPQSQSHSQGSWGPCVTRALVTSTREFFPQIWDGASCGYSGDNPLIAMKMANQEQSPENIRRVLLAVNVGLAVSTLKPISRTKPEPWGFLNEGVYRSELAVVMRAGCKKGSELRGGLCIQTGRHVSFESCVVAHPYAPPYPSVYCLVRSWRLLPESAQGSNSRRLRSHECADKATSSVPNSRCSRILPTKSLFRCGAFVVL